MWWIERSSPSKDHPSILDPSTTSATNRSIDTFIRLVLLGVLLIWRAMILAPFTTVLLMVGATGDGFTAFSCHACALAGRSRHVSDHAAGAGRRIADRDPWLFLSRIAGEYGEGSAAAQGGRNHHCAAATGGLEHTSGFAAHHCGPVDHSSKCTSKNLERMTRGSGGSSRCPLSGLFS